MITNLHLLRNVGCFDSVAAAANIPLAPLTLIYSENGRGKTTLAAIVRSLARGDPLPIVERRRLAAQHPPHVVIRCTGGPPDAMFQNGVWNRTLQNMVVFDEVFVDQNLYSGMVVSADHRQKLHELILGAQGIALNQQLQHLIARIEEHNAALRQRMAAIPTTERGTLSVDAFCALPQIPDVDQAIQNAERDLAASREQDPIRNTPVLELLRLPEFDIAPTERILQSGVADLDVVAAARVQEHLALAGPGAEEWAAEGMRRQLEMPAQNNVLCVFCAQDLSRSPVIAHYRAYFSAAYRDLKRSVVDALTTLRRTHADDAVVTFERSIRVMEQRRQFWSRFCDAPQLVVDTATVCRDWQAARDRLSELLREKQASPLDPIGVTDDVRRAIQTYEAHRTSLAAINRQIQQLNETIVAVKQRAAMSNVAAIMDRLAHLRATRNRHTPTTAALCDSYLEENRAKASTEQLRDQARAALEQYRADIARTYQTAINRYLTQFNAGFQLDSVAVVNTRGGPTCKFNVVINNVPVGVAGGEVRPGDHSFRNTLSAGDRNALALAFFFASLDHNPNLGNSVVVIDDPVSSLDDHRSLTTVQEIRRLVTRASQVIVLSHHKPFLCQIWQGADATGRAALHLTRDGGSSTIAVWNVTSDCITEHDRRHETLRSYLANGGLNEREIAKSIRPVLEAFCRVAWPEYFPPGQLLGPFIGICRQRLGTTPGLLNAQGLQELDDLVEYANRFHHDTNPAWQTQTVNATELTGFVRRTLAFATRQ